LIKKIKETRYGTEIEFYDSQNALIQLGKATGVLTERLDVTSKGEQVQVHLYLPDNQRENHDSDNR